MTQPTIIHIIRHGDVHNPQQVLYGRMPNFRLSDTGRKQAQAAADYLCDRPLAALFSSPMQRAQETAGFIAGCHPAVSLHIDERLNEVHTPYEGRPISELAARGWDLYTDTPAPYEQPADILRRTHDFMRQARQEFAGCEVAAVTHGDVIAMFFLFTKGLEPVPGMKVTLPELGLPEIYPSTASVSTLTYQTDDPDEVPDYSYTRPY